MFGFGIDNKQVAHLAGIIYGLDKHFIEGVTRMSAELVIRMPEYGDRNLAIIYGFASAGADHMGVPDKVMMRAMEKYFLNMPGGARKMLHLLKIIKDPSYEAIAGAAVKASEECQLEGSAELPMCRLAEKFLKNLI